MLARPNQKLKITPIFLKKQRNNTKNPIISKPILTYKPAMSVCPGRIGNILYIVLLAEFGDRKPWKSMVGF